MVKAREAGVQQSMGLQAERRIARLNDNNTKQKDFKKEKQKKT